MGCIFSQPILSDTSIIAHTRVYRYLYQRNILTYQNGATGILYTDGTEITYEAVCGDKRACCKCCKNSYPVSAVKNIQILNGPQIIAVKRPNGTPIPFGSTRTGTGILIITLEVDGNNAVAYAVVESKDLGTFPQTIARMSGTSVQQLVAPAPQ